MDIRVVFMGSPDFALPPLRALQQAYAIVGVVTQPDRPAGRGRTLKAPPVKELALSLDIPVTQPQRLNQPEAMDQLRAWNPDLIVVAAFGQILRPELLELPRYGCLNIHASLLPRWRGAAPINAAILHGDAQTGITIMTMDSGLDTGPIIRQRAIPIEANDTAGSLFSRMADLGAALLIDTLPNYLDGQLPLQAQDKSLATYAPMLKSQDGQLDFNQPADALARRVRAFNPWPGTFLIWNHQRIKIHHAHAISATSPGCGVLFTHKNQPAIGTAAGSLVLDIVQPAGKRAMPAETFLRGARDWGT
ncbi:MAG: methionyl-tRNA formyltransferase [Chloroflexi bacterium]|jgi:methionyl-tRNA formyltransferase|nr:methionyl-tRNA formyltransferase [Chloroflexota bacterium]